VGDRRGVYRVLVGRPEGKSHLEDLGVDGKIILKWIFNPSVADPPVVTVLTEWGN
jgi:hypothetical protein